MINDHLYFFAEAEKQQLINEAQGAAEAVVAAGKARAQSIEMVGLLSVVPGMLSPLSYSM